MYWTTLDICRTSMQISLRSTSNSSIQIPRRCQMRCVTYYTRVIWNPLLCRTHIRILVTPRHRCHAKCPIWQSDKNRSSALPSDEQIANSVELIWLTVGVCVCVCGGRRILFAEYFAKRKHIWRKKGFAVCYVFLCASVPAAFILFMLEWILTSSRMICERRKGCASALFLLFKNKFSFVACCLCLSIYASKCARKTLLFSLFPSFSIHITQCTHTATVHGRFAIQFCEM